jgi:hypothetical protein
VIWSDIQILLLGGYLTQDETRSVNEAAFPIYERLRISLREQRPRAPFRKLVIELSPTLTVLVRDAIGICEVEVPSRPPVLLATLPAVPLLVSAAQIGLGAVAARYQVSVSGLLSTLAEIRAGSPPCSYRLPKLSRKARSGERVETWFLSEFGSSRVEVRVFSTDPVPEVTRVALINGPLFLEDHFPVAKARIRTGFYELLDRDGAVLAATKLTRATPPSTP